ncbi:MAG: hypothetical protein LBS18_04850 [Clostridiales bacterium]|jgi:membrane-bound serine protease (ClpP class)|nr:hypothetical protein [Clostridiales bacterium]
MENMTATLICLGIGILLFVIEMFTPGLGIPGFVGALAFFAAVLLQINNPVGIVFMVALALFLISVGLLVFFRIVSGRKFENSKVVLNEKINGFSTNLTGKEAQALTGGMGKAVTPLRPAGKAEFDGAVLDVSTAGEYLPEGTRVTVEKVEGLRILVHAAPPEG